MRYGKTVKKIQRVHIDCEEVNQLRDIKIIIKRREIGEEREREREAERERERERERGGERERER